MISMIRKTAIKAILASLLFTSGALAETPPIATNDSFAYANSAIETLDDHNCSMWAAISESLNAAIVCNQLIESPNSLKYLSQVVNTDGWGIISYNSVNDTIAIRRGARKAYSDPNYDSAVTQLAAANPCIILAHIRNCSSGCCCHDCETIPNPHPFVRYKNGKWWSFEHNGRINKAILYNLIGSEFLSDNPPSGSYVPECDPSDTSLVVDSELYFLLLLEQIEKNNGNVFDGIVETVRLIGGRDWGAPINFILSDGLSIWAFRKGASLYYIYDSQNAYSAAATKYPDAIQGNWQVMNNYELVTMSSSGPPIATNLGLSLNLCNFIPGDMNGNREVSGSDVIFGVRYLKQLGIHPPDSCFGDNINGNHWLYAAGDVNGNCEFRGSDITWLVNFFKRKVNLDFCHSFIPAPLRQRPRGAAGHPAIE